VLLVPGGGDGADVIRRLDLVHGLGEEEAHWLALRVLAVNAAFLGTLLEVGVAPGPSAGNGLTILDPYAFCGFDEGRPGALEHAWTATSDAIAARVAEVVVGDLVMLKSTNLSAGLSWPDAAAAGLVDETFATVVGRANLRVSWINLRGKLPTR
jgi:aspartokinase-like uncharacterized kinase